MSGSRSERVEKLAHEPRLLLLCGRYEGFDDRIRQLLQPWEISRSAISCCNGGEVPAMVLIDSVIRLIPGVLGDEASAADESHSEEGRLEYPRVHARRGRSEGWRFPEILLSGNHQAVAKWRQEQSELRSRRQDKASGEASPLFPRIKRELSEQEQGR